MSQIIDRLTGVHWREQGPAFLVAFGHAGTHWVAAFFYLLLPYINHALGLSYTETGLMVSIFHASAFAANFGSGLVVDVTGRRVLFQVVSLLIGAAALLAFGVTARYAMLASLVVLIGVSNNLWHPPAITFLSRLYPRNRGYALSIHALGATLGDTFAPVAAGSLLLTYSWQGTATAGALPVFAVAALVALALLPRDTHSVRETHRRPAAGEYWSGLKALVKDRAVLGLCIMAGFRNMTQNGLYLFLPLYLVGVVKASPLWTGVAMMAMQVGGVVAAPAAGAWSDRVGRRPVVLAGLTMTTVVVIALTMIRNDALFVGGVSLLGFALFAVRPVVHSWLMDLTPPAMSGSATAVLFGTQSALSALIPAVGGMVADRFGLTAVFYLLAATMVVANFLVYLLPHHEPGHAPGNEPERSDA